MMLLDNPKLARFIYLILLSVSPKALYYKDRPFLKRRAFKKKDTTN